MVYLSKEMCQLLKAWRKECEWDRQQTANETVDEDDYLFRQPNGKPMKRYKETSGLIEWKECQIFHSIFT